MIKQYARFLSSLAISRQETKESRGILSGFLMLFFLLGWSVCSAQPWTYNFGTGTGTPAGAFTSSAASTGYLPAPTSGTSRVRVGTNPGSISLVNPGIALGTGSEMQFTSNTGSTSATRMSIYDYTPGKTGYAKFKIAFNGGTNGVYTFVMGDGTNFNANGAMGTGEIFAGIQFSLLASNAVTYNVLNNTTYGTTGITNSTTLFAQSTSNEYLVEIYMNNTTSSTSYVRNSNTYTLNNATWDLWVNGTKQNAANLAKGGLGTNANIDSLAFNHQASSSAPGTLYIDDIEYSNALPASISTPSPATLTGFATPSGTASTAQSFTVSGSNLTTDLVVTAPTDYEVSDHTLGVWGNTVSYTPSSGTVSTKTVDVRIKSSASVGSPSGNVAITSTSATTQNVAVSGTVSTPSSPNITITGSLTAFGNTVTGSSSTQQFYQINGDNLTNDITVTPPSGFEISTTSGTGFQPTFITLTQSGGTVALTTIYVRFSPSSANGANSGTITNISSGATQRDVAASGNAVAAEPTSASTVTFGTTTENSIVVNFSGGNGGKRILVARSGTAVSFTPTDAVVSTGVNADFFTATDQGSGNKIVYDGTGNTVTVAGLSPSTTYHFAVYEYNESTGTSQNYYATPGTGNQASSALPSYTQITSVDDLTDDNYLLVGDSATSDAIMLNTASATPFINLTSVSNPGTTISTGFTSANVFAVTVSAGQITIYNPTAGYVSYPGTGNTATFAGSVTNAEKWTYSVTGGVWALNNVGVAGRILRWNSSSPRFACYTGAATSTIIDLKLYKRVPTDPTLSGKTLTSPLSTTYGTAQATGVQTSASGFNLTGDITVTPQTGFEVSSTDATSGFTSSAITVPSGTNNIWVRFDATKPAGDYNNAVAAVLSGGGAVTSKNIVTSASGNTVSKATPTINTPPTASDVTYGQQLSASTLTGGSASVPGGFVFTTPATFPTAGTASYSVTFNPTDSSNYNTATTSVSVTALSPTITPSPTSITSLTYVEDNGPSNEVSFSVTATELVPSSGNITVSPSSLLEVWDGSAWTASAFDIPYTGGAVSTGAIYKVRLIAGLAALDSPFTGENIDLSGGGANAGITVSGTVSSASQPICPTSTTVVPAVPYTVCQGVTGATLTATINTAGSSPAPDLHYQWYFNTSDINDPNDTGAVAVGTDSTTYTPPTTGPEGSRYYFCVGYASNAECGSQTALTGLASATILVTVTPSVGTPSFTVGATTVCQDAADTTYTATADNASGITYSVSPSPTAGVINSSTGVMNWDAAFTGNATITATATGCNGPTTFDRIVTVTPTVGTPVFTAGATSTRCPRAESVSYSASATDTTGITYTLDATSTTAGNTISGSTVTFVAGYSGTTVITASAAGCGGPKTATHTVTITPALVTGSVSGVVSGTPGTHLVISQVYGAGGNASAAYRNDYVELYNPTISDVNIAGWSIQYAASGSGSSFAVNTIPSGSVVSAGKFFLVKLASGGSNGTVLANFDADLSAGSNMSATNGKVALVSNTTAIATTCPSGGTVVDLVGFGTASCAEGTAAPAPSATNAIFRSNLCTDTNSNSGNFAAAAASPRYSGTVNTPCATTSYTETICAGATPTSPITVPTATGGGGTGYTYQWYSIAGITTPTLTPNTGDWTPVGTGTSYSPPALTASTTYACYVTPTGAGACDGAWASNYRQVTVKPVAQLTVSNITPVCGATTADLTAASSSSNGASLSYFSDAYVTSVGDPTQVTTAQTYYVRATLVGGCTTDGTILVNAFKANPVVTASDVSGCSGTPIALAGSGTPSGGTGNYSVANPYTGTSSTTYTYTYTAPNGCVITTAPANITITAQPLWYLDADGDGYYTGAAQASCTSPGTGWTTATLTGGGDCDDTVAGHNGVAGADINPGHAEVCYNNVDDNCSLTLSEGCAPVVVNMTASYNNTTLPSFATAIPAVAYTYGSYTNIKYRFSITNVTTSTTAADIIQSSRYVNIPAALHLYGATYTIKVSAVINDEVVAFAGNTITMTAPSIQLITLAPASCGATLASLTSILTANPGANATGYTFRIRLDDANPSPTYGYSSSSSRFVGANTFTSFPLSYGTSYKVAVEYTFTDPLTSQPVHSLYGTECTVVTPSIPTTTIASPTCGSQVGTMSAGITATAAAYATGYQFRVRRTSDVGPTPAITYYYSVANASRFSSMTAIQGITWAYNTNYSVSVRYSISPTEWSDYGPECILKTPFFPSTQLVQSQCGLATPTSLTQQLNIIPYPGFPNYKVKLEENTGTEEAGAFEEKVFSYAYFKLNQFALAQPGKSYYVSVAIKQGAVFGDYSTVCDLFTPSSKGADLAFKATAYPNPFANNFMIDVRTSNNAAVNLKVYDMVGRLIEQRDVRVSDMGTTTIGDRYPSGVYNLVVSQQDSVETLRVVKR